MSTDQATGGPNAKVVPLRAADAPTETALGETEPPAYLDTTGADAGKRLPIMPEPWRRENIRGTLAQAAGLHWHRTRYHGLRSPAYLARLVFYAVRGVAPDGVPGADVVALDRRVGCWSRWPSPRAGPGTTRRCAPTPRASRPAAPAAGSSARRLAAAFVAVLAMARWPPWWGWALLGLPRW